MNIVNKTVYTLDTLYQFNKHYAKIKNTWITYLGTSFLAIAAFILHYYTSVTYGDGTLNLPIVFLIASVLIVDVIYILFSTVFLKYLIKKSPQLNAEVECVFTDEAIVENTVTKTVKQNTEISYGSVHKVTQNDDFIYIFIAKNAACIISKNGFTEGSPEALAALLRTKISQDKIKL